MTTAPPVRESELHRVDRMRPHPRNYRAHPPEQLAQIEASFRAYGVLPMTVLARDGTILGGHGVWMTAKAIGLQLIPATQLDIGPDEPAALALMAALNELPRLALDDEAALASLLADATAGDPAKLLGTGVTADDLMAMIARAADGLPEGFRELTPRPPLEPVPVICPRCGHSFAP